MKITNAQDFGKLINDTRKNSKLTQAQLAATSGTGERFVRELENGKPTCQLGKALLVAQKLGIEFKTQAPLPEETIYFAIGSCSLGSILVAHTKRGVCAILLGDNRESITQELQNYFPHAHLIADETVYEPMISEVVRFIENPKTGLSLPLDIRGTTFQQRVWQVLRQIPIGKTMSYSEIAQQLGTPKSARAVAKACATNVLALAIPCHRVIRQDGSLSGYRWGIIRKQALLERESK